MQGALSAPGSMVYSLVSPGNSHFKTIYATVCWFNVKFLITSNFFILPRTVSCKIKIKLTWHAFISHFWSLTCVSYMTLAEIAIFVGASWGMVTSYILHYHDDSGLCLLMENHHFSLLNGRVYHFLLLELWLLSRLLIRQQVMLVNFNNFAVKQVYACCSELLWLTTRWELSTLK